MTVNNANERTTLFIDGSTFYAAARALGMDIDYAKMRAFFARDTNLLRAYYYTALPEDQEFSPLRPPDRLAGLQWLCCSQQADA